MRLNIIGKSRTWVDAPYDDTPTWGITQLYLKRNVTMVIDMNVYDDGRWGELEKKEAEAVRGLCACNGVTVVDLESYPITDVIERFDTDYFSSTVDYAIALALYKGYTDIHLYGCTMSADTDYYKHKCGCDFWCGYAKGIGAKVTVHGATTIMKTVDGLIYGYDRPQDRDRASE